jgi:hypothetical protein
MAAAFTVPSEVQKCRAASASRQAVEHHPPTTPDGIRRPVEPRSGKVRAVTGRVTSLPMPSYRVVTVRTSEPSRGHGYPPQQTGPLPA